MMKKIVFVGGGTGGHIFPGLAVVSELKKNQDIECIWIGNSKGIDKSLVEHDNIQFYGIPSGKLRRYFSFQNFLDVFKIIFSVFYSFCILLKIKPNLIFSKGGFVSVPPCIAAYFLKIPIITHECDYSPGLATKINARFASKIFVSYNETQDFFKPKYKNKILVTGNPIRDFFYNGDRNKAQSFLNFKDQKKPILLILGGSLGAQQINELVKSCLPSLIAYFNIVHQTGDHYIDQTKVFEDPLIQEGYKVFPFIREEIADVLTASSLVLSRAGANSVWECAAVGKPMILVPLMKGNSRGDQYENASYFANKGAAFMLAGSEASPENLLKLIDEISKNPSILSSMAQNCKNLTKEKPSVLITSLLQENL